MKKIVKRILIIVAILITLCSFVSSINSNADGTWFLEQYIRRQ